MEQLKKPSIISGRTVIISMRILILIFCKSTNIRGETCIFAFKQSEIGMTAKEKIDQLRAELHRHNYNYYVLNAPEISDKEFDDMMRELQEMEREHPEYQDETSPTMRVGSDLNKNFTQVTHKYPMLSLGNTYSEGEVSDFYDRTQKP